MPAVSDHSIVRCLLCDNTQDDWLHYLLWYWCEIDRPVTSWILLPALLVDGHHTCQPPVNCILPSQPRQLQHYWMLIADSFSKATDFVSTMLQCSRFSFDFLWCIDYFTVYFSPLKFWFCFSFCLLFCCLVVIAEKNNFTVKCFITSCVHFTR